LTRFWTTTSGLTDILYM